MCGAVVNGELYYGTLVTANYLYVQLRNVSYVDCTDDCPIVEIGSLFGHSTLVLAATRLRDSV